MAAQYAITYGVPSFDAEVIKSTTGGAAVMSIGQPFGLCRLGYQSRCVIDGDTIEVDGQRIRMVDYDTPEIGEPKCASEAALGHRATLRTLALLNSGTVEITKTIGRDVDQFGRKLRLVTVDGRSIGATLISEGLAWSWEGRRHNWCG